ncbi:hypothetical protein [Methylocystis sp. SC2]|uniref:hypothetical protein n=1 Tax=Methylocystis sp. (strain SC2) TaxID=187303 RepID=UPI00027AE9F7|nr:hypothetical protein [Methylocystis sp. SC2]CCJ06810.1 Conserved hypothetical protein [Methylocystis sp. SC2]
MIHRSLLLTLFLLVFVDAATAQQSQPDWPCRQVRVPELAVGGVWAGPPLDDAVTHWRDDATIADLVTRLAQRRTPMDEAEQLIAQFAKSSGDKRKERLTTLFAGVYERMNDERRDLVNGLDRFGRRLKAMAETTRKETQTLRELQDQKPPDPEAIKKASEAVQWRLRVFEEQRRMVGYVCESPALIEQRFGALARAIQQAME